MSRDEAWAWCPAVGVSGRWLLQVFSWDFQVSLAGFSGICGRSCRKVTWTPAPLCFLPQLLLFLFCFRSGCLSALHPSVGIRYANSQDLGFPSSTWTLDLLSEPTGPCCATLTFSYYFLEVAQVM